jgi:hypothetical protein
VAKHALTSVRIRTNFCAYCFFLMGCSAFNTVKCFLTVSLGLPALSCLIDLGKLAAGL